MLKTRTLGPEHSETQTQLRRSIRVLHISVLNEHVLILAIDNAGPHPETGGQPASIEEEIDRGYYRQASYQVSDSCRLSVSLVY